jgi:hypothetical protein
MVTNRVLLVSSLILNIIFASSPSHGNELEIAPTEVVRESVGAPKLEVWVKEYLSAKRPQANARWVHRFALVSDLAEQSAGQPVFREDVSPDQFNRLGWLSLANGRNLSWDMKLNPPPTGRSLTPAENAFRVGDLDTIVIAPDEGNWRLARLSNEFHVEIVAELPPPKKMVSKSLKASELSTWLFKQFNYDGVVLDQKGPWVLVGAAAARLKEPGVQALALKSSEEKIFVASGDRTGLGILSLVSIGGGFGLFEIVLLENDETKILPGTKLIIEKATRERSVSP